jgi:hypothetical protein
MDLRTDCLLDVLKIDFGEVNEASLKGFERPFEDIFCILSIENSYLDEDV